MKYLYLAHHGIRGQKWGERNGPPYPLKAGAHSAAEKRANVKYGSIYSVASGEDTTYYVGNNNNATSLGYKLKTDPSSIREDVDAVNPGYRNPDNNCSNCVMTYALRRMGLDVEALPLQYGRAENEIAEVFNGSMNSDHRIVVENHISKTHVGMRQRVEESINKLCGDGPGVGYIGMQDGYGHGHVFSWERTPGKRIVFLDAQVRGVEVRNKRGTSIGPINNYFYMMDHYYLFPEASISRLDNCKVNKSALDDVCKNR